MAQSRGSKSGNRHGLVSVLIARFSAIGDVAMTLPAIYSACRCYPDINFVMVTRPSMVNIFVNAPRNLTVLGKDVNVKYRGALGMRRLVAELDNEYRFDAFLDLHSVIRTRLMALWCRLRGIRTFRINKGRGARRALTRAKHKVMLPLTSQRSRYREVFFKAGLPLTEHFEGIYGARNAADPRLFGTISQPKPTGAKWIAIAPFAAHAGKVYPPQQMYKVVEALSQLPGVHVFLLGGGKTEQTVLESWAAGRDNVTSLAGKRYGFAAEMALLNHADVVVTMDSANMHLASLASAPTISVWGATHPYCGFKGWRQNDSDTIQLPLTCRPCSVFGEKPCRRGDYLCLNAIKPETILEKVKEKLKN